MSDWQASNDALQTTVFDTFGEEATWTAPGESSVPVQAVLDEQTHLQGELGTVTDPRPSVWLQRPIVGDKPRGTLTIGARSFQLDRPVDEGDAHVVRMFLRPD